MVAVILSSSSEKMERLSRQGLVTIKFSLIRFCNVPKGMPDLLETLHIEPPCFLSRRIGTIAYLFINFATFDPYEFPLSVEEFVLAILIAFQISTYTSIHKNSFLE